MTMDIDSQSSLINCQGVGPVSGFGFRISCFPPEAGAVSSIVRNEPNRRRRPERSRTDLAPRLGPDNAGRATKRTQSSPYGVSPGLPAVALYSFMPNKANYMRFWARNEGQAEKQSQSGAAGA